MTWEKASMQMWMTWFLSHLVTDKKLRWKCVCLAWLQLKMILSRQERPSFVFFKRSILLLFSFASFDPTLALCPIFRFLCSIYFDFHSSIFTVQGFICVVLQLDSDKWYCCAFLFFFLFFFFYSSCIFKKHLLFQLCPVAGQTTAV